MNKHTEDTELGNSNQSGTDKGNDESKEQDGKKLRNNTGLGKAKKDDYTKEATILDSDFVALDDLVYAPLHALAESNHKLRSEIVNNIKNMASVDNKDQEETYHLKKINIAYDQVRSDVDDSYSVDKLQVQVPLLSIIPITNLGIEEAEIGFSAEVRTQENMDKSERKFEARVCSPEQRESDFLPRVSYKMKIKSIPATEGIMRLVDSLSSNQVAKKLESKVISPDGNPTSMLESNEITSINELKVKVTKLKQLYSKVSDTLEEMAQLNKIKKDPAAKDDVYDINYFEGKKTAIINEILKCQDEIIRKEISCVASEGGSK